MDITEIREKAKSEGVDFKTALLLLLDELLAAQSAILTPGKCPACNQRTAIVTVAFDTTQDTSAKHPIVDTCYRMQCARATCGYMGGKADSMALAVLYYEDDLLVVNGYGGVR